MRTLKCIFLFACSLFIASGTNSASSWATDVEINIDYPLAAAGTDVPFTEMARQFEKENPNIKINVNVIKGTANKAASVILTETVLSKIEQNKSPDLFIACACDLFTFLDLNIVDPISAIATKPDDAEWLRGFNPAVMRNSKIGDKIVSIPMQRSVGALYWNKDMFKAAGLDPDMPPKNWDEFREFGKKLTLKDPSGEVTQWGAIIPNGSLSRLFLQAIEYGNNHVTIYNSKGNKVNYLDKAVIDSLQFWANLSVVDKVQPMAPVEQGEIITKFQDKKLAMGITTAAAIGTFSKNAKFSWGVSTLPTNGSPSTYISGQNFYLPKGLAADKQMAALAFVKWMTSDEKSADWAVSTGYPPVREGALKTPQLTNYMSNLPVYEPVARSLNSAIAEMTMHEQGKLAQIANEAILETIAGKLSAKEALEKVQNESEKILKDYN